MLQPNLAMGFYFSPRGGSAQVARYLCRALDGSGWVPALFTGSVGAATEDTNAERFFTGIPCSSLDYSPAVADWKRGSDPMAASVPMHASFEDKTDVPDRIFFDLDEAAFDRQVSSWIHLFSSRTVRPEVVHLHHLTPMHEAARVVWPGVPVVTHLHGTELKMLTSAARSTSARPPMRSEEAWIERMRRWAAASHRIVVLSAQDDQLARQVLPVTPAQITTIANGVDTSVFSPRTRSAAERLALWTRLFVDDARGWRPGGRPGSIAYHDADLSELVDPSGRPVPVVVFAGRFLDFKRLGLLIEAHHAMRSTTSLRSVLVVVGGFPGEWEGEHPYDTVRRLGAKGVYFVGWRDHGELAEILSCSDVFAALARDEPFGLVYLEAMAAGVPPLATATGGPASFINVDAAHPTGWLVAPDDLGAATAALTEAVSNETSRARRGERAASFVQEHYSWENTARAFVKLYVDVTSERAARQPIDS